MKTGIQTELAQALLPHEKIWAKLESKNQNGTMSTIFF